MMADETPNLMDYLPEQFALIQARFDRLEAVLSVEPNHPDAAPSQIEMDAILFAARLCTIKVGDGFGFMMKDDQDDLVVVTAAHCLPHMPPVASASHLEERTYERLLGQLGDEPSIAAVVRFVDPVADIAILGTPCNQEMPQQTEVYNTLAKFIRPLRMARLEFAPKIYTRSNGQTVLGDPEAEADAWLLGLDGEWFSCRVSCHRGIWISKALKPLQPGMSGSPIMTREGVIGIVSVSGGGVQDTHLSGPQPYLPRSLPGWMLDTPEVDEPAP